MKSVRVKQSGFKIKAFNRVIVKDLEVLEHLIKKHLLISL